MECHTVKHQIITSGSNLEEYPENLQQHMLVCTTCMSLFKNITETEEEIKLSDPIYSSEFTEKVLNKSGFKQTSSPSSFGIQRRLIWVTSAAAIFIGFVIGLSLAPKTEGFSSSDTIESEIAELVLSNSVASLPEILIQTE